MVGGTRLQTDYVGHVRALFLGEAAVLGIAGTILGIVLGRVLAALLGLGVLTACGATGVVASRRGATALSVLLVVFGGGLLAVTDPARRPGLRRSELRRRKRRNDDRRGGLDKKICQW